jgi:alpha-galactosidase
MAETARSPRIVLVGAGSTSFGISTIGDLLTVGAEPLAGATVVLHDIDAPSLEATRTVFLRAMEEHGKGSGRGACGGTGHGRQAAPPFRVESTTDPHRALDGAEFVIVSIEHGNRLETWKQDYYVPLSYGSRQVYGENGGAGGAFHTWRQIAPLLRLASIMEEHCPDAWLLNFSNPVPRLVRAVLRATRIRTVGLCHGIGTGLTSLERILGTPLAHLDYTSAGLNHFYWFVRVAAKTAFRMPAMAKQPAMEVAKGTDLLPALRERGLAWAIEEELPLTAELLKTYGYLGYPEESHPAEYLAWADAYSRSVKYDFKRSAEQAVSLKERLAATAAGREDNAWWVRPSGERAVQIIAGLANDTGQHEDAVNVPNDGAIENLPADSVVEVPARIDRRGIHPEKVGPLPLGIAHLLRKEIIVQEAVVEAALSEDYDDAVRALMLDETVPTPQVARLILDRMIVLQKDLLPPFHGRRENA